LVAGLERDVHRLVGEVEEERVSQTFLAGGPGYSVGREHPRGLVLVQVQRVVANRTTQGLGVAPEIQTVKQDLFNDGYLIISLKTQKKSYNSS
jgi:hypothetical protein